MRPRIPPTPVEKIRAFTRERISDLIVVKQGSMTEIAKIIGVSVEALYQFVSNDTLLDNLFVSYQKNIQPFVKEANAELKQIRTEIKDAIEEHRNIITSYTDEEIKDALVQGKGYITRAARILGCSPQTISKQIKASVVLQEIVFGQESWRLDFVESKLMQACSKGNISAIKYYLNAKGRERGYGFQRQGPSTTTPIIINVECPNHETTTISITPTQDQIDRANAEDGVVDEDEIRDELLDDIKDSK